MINQSNPRVVLRDLRLLASAWYTRHAEERRVVYERPDRLRPANARARGRSSWPCLQR